MRQSIRSVFACLTIFIVFLPDRAFGQTKNDAETTAAARAHFERATRLFDSGSYTQAIEEYKQAYVIKPNPFVLYALGLAYEGAGDKPAALENFTKYLEQDPKGTKAPDARQRVAALEREVSGEKAGRSGSEPASRPLSSTPAPVPEDTSVPTRPAPAPQPVETASQPTAPPRDEPKRPAARPTEPSHPAPRPQAEKKNPRTISLHETADENPGHTRRVTGLVVGGVGVAAVAVGALFGLSAMSKWRSAKENGCNDSGGCYEPGYSMANDAKSAALLGEISLGVGVAALAAGGYLYFAAPSASAGKESATLRFSPLIAPNAFAITLSGGF